MTQQGNHFHFIFPDIIPEKLEWLTLDTWLVSDTHFNHHNIIQYCNRPADWQEDFIQHWQTTVQQEDVLLHLGDVVFGRKTESAELIHLLPGNKHLILGNHDRGLNWMKDVGFSTVQREPIIAEFPEHLLILSHYPLKIENLPKTSKRIINIHGHIHTNPSPVVVDGFHINISIEMMEYQLCRLGDVIKEI